MSPKPILLVNNQSLLMEATEHLLKSNGDFTVITTYAQDLTSLISEIERSQPKVIITDEDTYFIEPTRLIASLRKIPNVRLIVLNNRQIDVNIYEKYERTISDPSQLMEAIGLDHSLFKAD